MSLGVQDLPADTRYAIFEALSHSTRVRILELVQEKQLSFSQLKRELGVESSGQLQRHLLKLSGFIEVEAKSGCYVLTGTGRRALDIYALSRTSGTPLEAACCLPVKGATTPGMHVGRTGTELRLSYAVTLLAVTATYFWLGEPSLRFGSATARPSEARARRQVKCFRMFHGS